ncbi:hypothetical protein [Streptomyces sp. NBC_00687]|uniref:hypothetical protein n=1 Tax=Streptomyces sp. NBC_00687 TaxID=2975807 RepID=UPI002257E436|nr:hypothetical protein [Streptomyces sp. NBC_00687]MCX4912861.1 hypothetical protein [Streptomyces sp. NBC_00687]
MPYTTGENLRRAMLLLKGGRQASAGVDPRIDAELDRMKDRKDERREADEAAMRSVLGRARVDSAAAKAKVRTARGGAEKRAARDEQREVDRGLRRVERAARRDGYRV